MLRIAVACSHPSAALRGASSSCRADCTIDSRPRSKNFKPAVRKARAARESNWPEIALKLANHRIAAPRHSNERVYRHFLLCWLDEVRIGHIICVAGI